MNKVLREEFEAMARDEKISYLMQKENREQLPDELTGQAISLLAGAGEIEYAVVMARDRDMIDEAIRILVDAGDYLWAALIARNAGRSGQSQMLYQEGLQYYIDMEMFGRAVSAATALDMPAEKIDEIFRQGIEFESKSMDLGRSRAIIESALESLEISLIGRDDETSLQIMKALEKERERRLEDEARAADNLGTENPGQDNPSQDNHNPGQDNYN